MGDLKGKGQERGDAFNTSRQFGVLPRHMSCIGDEYHQAYLDRLRKEAGRHVRRHREVIARLAEELLQRTEMSGEDVEAVVKPLLPRRYEAEKGGGK
jgi:hypothetical protein